MKNLTLAQVLELHGMILAETGGAPGVHDEGRIETALARPFAGFGDQEFFPTMEEKAAALAHALIKGHPFVDANKRTGMTAAASFLELNGYELTASQEDLEETAVAIAEDRMGVAELAEWFKANMKPITGSGRDES